MNDYELKCLTLEKSPEEDAGNPIPCTGLSTSGTLMESPDTLRTKRDEEIIPTCGTLDCGGKCLVKAHIQDGVITRISTGTGEEAGPENPYMRACVRGRSYRKFLYHPDRLKYPMKRTGKRGEGKFERISWDEAIDTIAEETKRITDKYGPASRFIHLGTAGAGGSFWAMDLAARFFALSGGYLSFYHSVSTGNTVAATPYTFGTHNTGSSLDSLADTKLVILWGHNPTETIFGNTNHYFQQMKKNGCRFIVVDPRFSDTAVAYADEWIPILPTTDNAMMDAMAYIIVTENLHDKKFIDTFVLGFDEDHMPEGVPAGESLVSYLLGRKDGVKKTPEWAESICKVPAEKIRNLAREYAMTKPAALIQGWGPQRHACGERTARGSTVLTSITGNVGIIGGWAGGFGGIKRKLPVRTPVPENPVKASISIMNWIDAITNPQDITREDGLKGVDKLDTGIKLIFNLGGNYLANQNPDINRAVKALEDDKLVEFIVVSDLFLTPSARYADILLPGTTFLERWDLGGSSFSGDYFILSEKVVENYYESKFEYDWLAETAKKLGFDGKFTEGRDNEGWIRYLLDETRKLEPETPSWEELMEKHIHAWKYSGPRVAFKEQIDDPANNKFDTPSGKIEIFSKRLYDMKNEEIPAVPKYIPAWEGPQDELAKKYPIQLIGWKGKNRDNSTFFNNPWMQEVQSQILWMNPLDAKVRGLVSGDKVKVYNDRGDMLITLEVTPRIMPGVAAAPTGAWWSPDTGGVDHGGCTNVLTTDRKTPLAHGNAHHTCLVEVQKYDGGL